MKELFAKLLLGEDMSGEGKGVCTALAISNAITNLSGLLLFFILLDFVFLLYRFKFILLLQKMLETVAS